MVPNCLISACLIVRDQAAHLDALFKSAGLAVVKWIVVDIGSVDGTVEVEAPHARGARVLHRPWDDDHPGVRWGSHLRSPIPVGGHAAPSGTGIRIALAALACAGWACLPLSGQSVPDYDGDGFVDHRDCVPDDAGIYPDALDLTLDGVDQDCLGTDGVDLDSDGIPVQAGDCNDNDRRIGPGNPEVVDGVDNDCDGLVDCGSVIECIANSQPDDADQDGWSVGEGDCDDTEPLRFPGNAEVCDGVDNDCDCSSAPPAGEFDRDRDGYLSCGPAAPSEGGVPGPGGVPVLGGSDPDDCDPEVIGVAE